MQERQFIGLELFRFICAVSVIVWHYQHFAMINGNIAAPIFAAGGEPFHNELALFYRYGDLSVNLF